MKSRNAQSGITDKMLDYLSEKIFSLINGPGTNQQPATAPAIGDGSEQTAPIPEQTEGEPQQDAVPPVEDDEDESSDDETVHVPDETKPDEPTDITLTDGDEVFDDNLEDSDEKNTEDKPEIVTPVQTEEKPDESEIAPPIDSREDEKNLVKTDEDVAIPTEEEQTTSDLPEKKDDEESVVVKNDSVDSLSPTEDIDKTITPGDKEDDQPAEEGNQPLPPTVDDSTTEPVENGTEETPPPTTDTEDSEEEDDDEIVFVPINDEAASQFPTGQENQERTEPPVVEEKDEDEEIPPTDEEKDEDEENNKKTSSVEHLSRFSKMIVLASNNSGRGGFKDKDVSDDTGGKTFHQKTPEFKPGRDDTRKRFHPKRTVKEERDDISKDTSRDKDMHDPDMKVSSVPVVIDYNVNFSGELVVERRDEDGGWGYLDLDNAIRDSILDALKLPSNYVLPEHNAHISVFDGVEVPQLPRQMEEEGQKYTFTIKQLSMVEPDGWDEVDHLYMVVVDSPELEQLRVKYGFSPKMHDGKHEFHITLAICKKVSSSARLASMLLRYSEETEEFSHEQQARQQR